MKVLRLLAVLLGIFMATSSWAVERSADLGHHRQTSLKRRAIYHYHLAPAHWSGQHIVFHYSLSSDGKTLRKRGVPWNWDGIAFFAMAAPVAGTAPFMLQPQTLHGPADDEVSFATIAPHDGSNSDPATVYFYTSPHPDAVPIYEYRNCDSYGDCISRYSPVDERLEVFDARGWERRETPSFYALPAPVPQAICPCYDADFTREVLIDGNCMTRQGLGVGVNIEPSVEDELPLPPNRVLYRYRGRDNYTCMVRDRLIEIDTPDTRVSQDEWLACRARLIAGCIQEHGG